MVNNFDKKVRWDFAVPIYGYGKNCKEALLNALNDEIGRIKRDYSDDDLESIEMHNLILISPEDIDEEDE
jgi:hypothetical protein